MNRQHVHMRDHKDSIVVMAKFRHRRALQENMENCIMLLSVWAIAVLAGLQH
jgi:hypothetical protein